MKKSAAFGAGFMLSLGLAGGSYAEPPPCIASLPDKVVWNPRQSLVKFWKDADHKLPSGTGIIIDGERGLILTASHVVADVAYFSIPGVAPDRFYTGSVKQRWEQAGELSENSGTHWGEARDLAVVQSNGSLGRGVGEAELSFTVDDSGHVSFYGFPLGIGSQSQLDGNYMVPNTTAAVAAGQSTDDLDKGCTRGAYVTTDPGQSGGPAINDKGELIGIVIEQTNYNTIAIFVPVSCIRETLASMLPDDAAQGVIDAIAQKTPKGLDIYLRGRKPGGPSNMEILASFMAIRSKHDRLPHSNFDKVSCPLLDASNRGVPSNGLIEWFADQPQLAQKAGNVALRQAQLSLAAGQVDRARPIGLLSKNLLSIAASSLPSTSTSSGQKDFEAASALKSYADAEVVFKLAGGSADLNAAQVAAMQAAMLATTRKQKGAALATAGQASYLARNAPLATQLYAASKASGFTDSWALKAASAAKRDSGSQPLAVLTDKALQDLSSQQGTMALGPWHDIPG